MKTKNNYGFTIIELLVVISVIAIIVGIAVPRFRGMQDEANKAKSKSELKTLQTAVESYYINQNPQEYPESTTTVYGSYLSSANPKIISSALYDSFSSSATEYLYWSSPNIHYYVIVSVGPNGNADITGIGDDGLLTGSAGDDIWVTNGTGF